MEWWPIWIGVAALGVGSLAGLVWRCRRLERALGELDQRVDGIGEQAVEWHEEHLAEEHGIRVQRAWVRGRGAVRAIRS